jgi:tetratricopeptide (TPR) repeat protein
MPLEWPGAKEARAQQHYERALHYHQQGETLLAIADLGQAIKASRRAKFFSARAFLWAERDEHDYAEADCESALELDPQDMLARYVMGMVGYAQQDYEQAIRHFTQALSRDPQRSECYYFRSVCHYKNGALEQAEIDMNFARGLMPAEDTRQLDAARWLNVYKRDSGKSSSIRRRPR